MNLRKENMGNLINPTIHPQVRIFVAMLCEGFNVPSSETKIQAFANKLKHPHIPALMETYEIFTDGRASTTKMPTIAEVMAVYRGVEKRLTQKTIAQITNDKVQGIDYSESKRMFSKLITTIKSGGSVTTGITDLPVTDFQGGYKFTLSKDEKGQSWVYFHNHPVNEE